MQPFIPDGADLPLERFTLIMRRIRAGKAPDAIATEAGVTERRVIAMAGLARKTPKQRPQQRRRTWGR